MAEDAVGELPIKRTISPLLIKEVILLKGVSMGINFWVFKSISARYQRPFLV